MKKQFILVCLLSASGMFLSACNNDEQGKSDGVQKVAIVQGLKTAALFKTQLATYYTEYQTCNENSTSQNDRALTKIHYVQDIVTNSQCQIIITFKNDKTLPDLSQKQITLTMHPMNNTYNWSCQSNILRKDLLPQECK